MNFLLLNFMTDLFPAIVIIAGIAIGVLIGKLIDKKNRKPSDRMVTKNQPKKLNLKLKQEYITEKEMVFLTALHKALPKDCISFPKIGVDTLVEPKNNLVDYKSILHKYVDVCIFMRDGMMPIMAIDLIDSNPIKQSLKEMDTNVTNALKTVDIKVVKIQIQDSYDINDLKKKLLDNLPTRAITYFKEKLYK